MTNKGTADIDAKTLRAALDAARVWRSGDETRPHLTAVRIEKELIAATDGHGLLVCHVALGVDTLIGSIDLDKLIAVLEAAPDRADVVVEPLGEVAESQNVKWSVAGIQLTTTCVSESFPPWRKVMPRKDAEPVALPAIEVSGEMLARIAKTFEADRNGHSHLSVSFFGSKMDPVLITGMVAGTRAELVAMPARPR